jgi:hypothetical protein
MLFRAIHLSLSDVSRQQVVGGKRDGETGILIHFDDFLVSSIFLNTEDAVKLRDALIAMSEINPCSDDDGEGWKKGRKEEE